MKQNKRSHSCLFKDATISLSKIKSRPPRKGKSWLVKKNIRCCCGVGKMLDCSLADFERGPFVSALRGPWSRFTSSIRFHTSKAWKLAAAANEICWRVWQPVHSPTSILVVTGFLKFIWRCACERGEKRESQRRRFAPIEFYSSGNRPERVANASRGNWVFVGRLQRLTGLRRSPAKYEFLFRFFT